MAVILLRAASSVFSLDSWLVCLRPGPVDRAPAVTIEQRYILLVLIQVTFAIPKKKRKKLLMPLASAFSNERSDNRGSSTAGLAERDLGNDGVLLQDLSHTMGIRMFCLISCSHCSTTRARKKKKEKKGTYGSTVGAGGISLTWVILN